jgi:hypothetical protein
LLLNRWDTVDFFYCVHAVCASFNAFGLAEHVAETAVLSAAHTSAQVWVEM